MQEKIKTLFARMDSKDAEIRNLKSECQHLKSKVDQMEKSYCDLVNAMLLEPKMLKCKCGQLYGVHRIEFNYFVCE